MGKSKKDKKKQDKKSKQQAGQLWSKFKSLITIDDTVMDETFSLGEREMLDIPEDAQKELEQFGKGGREEKQEKKKKDTRPLKSPRKVGSLMGQPARKPEGKDDKSSRKKQGKDGVTEETAAGEHISAYQDNSGKRPGPSNDGKNPDQDENEANKWQVSTDIEVNKKRVKQTFVIPPNKDMVIREFYIALKQPVKAFIVYIDGAVNSKVVDDNILQPLMLLAHLDRETTAETKAFDIVNEKLTPINQASPSKEFKKMVSGVLNGDTAIFVDGADQGLVVETKGWPGRSVSDPKNENVIRGPQEAFAENLRLNTGLVRKRLRTEALVTEMFQIGKFSQTNVAMMYLDGVVNPKLVREMRRRLKSIKIDYAAESGIIEQYLDDNDTSFVPTVLSTERPDRVAGFLSEGHIAVIVDGSTYALIMPVTFWAELHTPEDYYLRWPIASFLRWLRFVSFFLGLLTPAFYIAVTNYHPEMIPTDLLFSIAATREKVPFPVVIEVLLMEFSFELIREAGVRIPGIIGPTIGIVGALILGQAAVAASIVSPILVIVVAITGLAASVLPNYSFNLAVRIARFIFIAAAAFFGFVGIAVVLFIFNIQTVGQKSLGVPMVSPVAPWRPPSHDIVSIMQNFRFNRMPVYIRAMKKYRQVKFNRVWEPSTQKLFKSSKKKHKESGDNDG